MTDEYGPDGIRNHPDRRPGCRVCGGGGWLDDGDYAMVLVPCPCTGQAPPDVVRKVRAAYGDG